MVYNCGKETNLCLLSRAVTGGVQELEASDSVMVPFVDG